MSINDKQPPTLATESLSGEEGNPLRFIKSFKQRLKNCSERKKAAAGPRVTYLWMCVSAEGIGNDDSPDAKTLTLDEWLAVIDESASIGANWVVLSLATSLSARPEIWELCRWAQQAHQMTVGLHLCSADISPEEAGLIQSLDTTKVRLLVRGEWLEQLQYLEGGGVELWTANPQENGVKPHCQGPTKMIYVNAQGFLYTCGLVDGMERYRMGHVMEGPLQQIVQDPALPRQVEEAIHKVSEGCDGCPSLVANFFIANMTENI